MSLLVLIINEERTTSMNGTHTYKKQTNNKYTHYKLNYELTFNNP